MTNPFTKIKNYFFIKKYPFMAWYGDPLYPGYPQKKRADLGHTWYDEIPCGWRIAFGKKLLKDLKNVIKRPKDLQWEQIKEKWGSLCLYASCSDEVQKVLDRYEVMSIGYCISCGKPARYRTRGWVEYYCEDCHNEKLDLWGKYHEPYTKEQIDKIKEEERLTEKDIPIYTEYDYSKSEYDPEVKHINIEETYGVEFKKLWGLK